MTSAESAPPLDASGVIVAGGKSRRMGRDKALLASGGETLLDRTVRVLRSCATDILIVGRNGSADSSVRWIPDGEPGRGPLAGLVDGLHAARFPHVMAVACDLPFLDERVLRRLLTLAAGHDAVVPVIGSRAQPLHAIYMKHALPILEKRFAGGDGSLRDAIRALRVRWVHEAELIDLDSQLRSFVNVNTPEDWNRVLAIQST